ncbi:hypothetical protein TWF694_004666 [Orbilia ellipsospora]|uniref:Uncharacterized protein n=1 Tax=Orbilia ellipsospora TaxID=2528407 RepID=A0AAV9WWS3_9PEZI
MSVADGPTGITEIYDEKTSGNLQQRLKTSPPKNIYVYLFYYESGMNMVISAQAANLYKNVQTGLLKINYQYLYLLRANLSTFQNQGTSLSRLNLGVSFQVGWGIFLGGKLVGSIDAMNVNIDTLYNAISSAVSLSKNGGVVVAPPVTIYSCTSAPATVTVTVPQYITVYGTLSMDGAIATDMGSMSTDTMSTDGPIATTDPGTDGGTPVDGRRKRWLAPRYGIAPPPVPLRRAPFNNRPIPRW